MGHGNQKAIVLFHRKGVHETLFLSVPPYWVIVRGERLGLDAQ